MYERKNTLTHTRTWKFVSLTDCLEPAALQVLNGFKADLDEDINNRLQPFGATRFMAARKQNWMRTRILVNGTCRNWTMRIPIVPQPW